jgi:ketosteroid isomerase-like protein
VSSDEWFRWRRGPVQRGSSRVREGRFPAERDDVVLCNPFHPFARGPNEVARTTEEAASHFADGTLEVERVVAFSTADLGYVVQIERFAATIDGQHGSGALRVTLIFRREGDGWKVSHRHADPITTPRATGSILQAWWRTNDLRDLLLTLSPATREHLRSVLIRDQADRDPVSSRLSQPSLHQNLGSGGVAQSMAKPRGSWTCLPANRSSQ